MAAARCLGLWRWLRSLELAFSDGCARPSLCIWAICLSMCPLARAHDRIFWAVAPMIRV